MTTFDPKDPTDISDYTLSWTAVLNGDTIASLVSVVSNQAALVVEASPAPSFTTTSTTWWLSGGTADTQPRVTITVMTTGGRRLQRSVVIPIREQ